MNLEIKQVYSFDVYPVALLGNNFKNVTIVGVMDQEQANREIDTQALHIQVYPTLPAGTPNRPDGYNYVKIKFPSGNTTILGMAWIKDSTVVQVSTSTITAVISNVAPTDVSRLRDALIQNGFSNIQLSVQ